MLKNKNERNTFGKIIDTDFKTIGLYIFVLIVLASVGSVNSLYGKELRKPDNNIVKGYRKDFAKLNDSQKEVFELFTQGMTHADFRLSTLAIAWEESHFGKFQMNYNKKNDSYDCGLFGNNTNTILNRADEKRSDANKKMVCTRLILRKEYALKHLLIELMYWKNRYTSKNSTDWYKVWASYNGGNNPNYNYAARIFARISVIKENIKGK